MTQTATTGDTIDVKDAHRFDEARLFEYLRANVDGFEGPLTVKQFEGGQSNPDVLPHHADAQLRAAPQAAGSADEVGARGRTRIPRDQRAESDRFRRAARLRACAKTRTVIGTSFFVMSHVPGHARTDPSMPDLAPAARRSLVHSYIDTLADAARGRPRRGRPRRLRSARQLLCAAGVALVAAVSRDRNREAA